MLPSHSITMTMTSWEWDCKINLSYKEDLLNWQVSSIWGFTGTAHRPAVASCSDLTISLLESYCLSTFHLNGLNFSFLRNVSGWKRALISIFFRRFSGNSVKVCATSSNDGHTVCRVKCTCPTASYATVGYGQGQQRFLAWCHKICILKREQTQRGSKWPSKPFSLKTAFPMKKKRWMVNI